MTEFYERLSFIVGFMVLLVVFNMILGTKSTEYFLILVLMGMILTNIDSFTGLFNNLLSAPKTSTHTSSSGRVHGGGGGTF